jgi:FkbM family methyltransferase
MPILPLLDRLNRAAIWRRRVHVWGHTVRATSLDRLLCLWLHRAGMMGRAERAFLEATIRPGMRIVDVGANLGLYTLLLARLTGPAGQVHAFEPEPALFQALTRNCRRNAAANVTTVNCALGAGSGRIPFYRSLFNSGDNRLGGLGWKGRGVEVEMARLDDVLPEPCVDFIKMDVQGYEMQVLQGMERIIEASPRLMLYFEFWPCGLRSAGTDPAALLDFLFQRGFRIDDVEDGIPTPITGFGCLERRLTGEKYTNLLASRGE